MPMNVPMSNMPTMPPTFSMLNGLPNMSVQGGQFNQPPMAWQSKPIPQSKNN
jgi:hypothetical protein